MTPSPVPAGLSPPGPEGKKGPGVSGCGWRGKSRPTVQEAACFGTRVPAWGCRQRVRSLTGLWPWAGAWRSCGLGEDGLVHLTVHVSTGSSRSWFPYLVPVPVEIVSESGKQGEAGPLLGDLGDLIDVADGVHVWCRSHLEPDVGGESTGQTGITAVVCSWALGSAVFS